MSEEQLNIDAVVKWVENSRDGEVQKSNSGMNIENYDFIIGGFDFRVSRFTSSTGQVSDTLHVRRAMEDDNVLVTKDGASEIYFAAYHRERKYKALKKIKSIKQINETLAELIK